MKLFAYRGREPNFGDELNYWLMPRVFPDLFDDDASTIFLGIGSTLYHSHPPEAHKIVFGTGFGGYTRPPQLDESWHVYGLRGHRTAQALGLSAEHVAADAAILINRFRPPRRSAATGVSFMPHFQSVRRGRWQRACRMAGIAFIDPRAPVEIVIEQIEASALVISEAMHGAVVADALRVPWIASLPFDRAHRMKWDDWGSALEMLVRFRRLVPSSADEGMILCGEALPAGVGLRRLLKTILTLLNPVLVLAAAISLKLAAARGASLSSDRALEAALARLDRCADRIRHDLQL